MKIPTIKSLRQSGWKVRVTHFRYFNTERIPTGFFELPRFIVKLLNVRDMKTGNGYYKIYPNPCGGKTIVELRNPEGVEFKGESLCSQSDGFNRKEGIARAIVRALDIKPKVREVGSKAWLIVYPNEKMKIREGTIVSNSRIQSKLDFSDNSVDQCGYYVISVKDVVYDEYKTVDTVFDTKEELLAALTDES